MKKAVVIILVAALLGSLNYSSWSAGTLKVTTPNAGQSWTSGKTHTIKWQKGNAGASVQIQLLKSGKHYKWVTKKTKNDGKYRWKIPATVATGSQYMIKIVSTKNKRVFDKSNRNFTITKASTIKVTLPNGGEIWEPGKAFTIMWDKGNGEGRVKIQLLRSGKVYKTLHKRTWNDGKFRWKIPSSIKVGSRYRIKITLRANTAITDSSDSNFTLSKNHANYDENFYGCSYIKPTLTCFGNQGGILSCGLTGKSTVTCGIEGVYAENFNSCSLFGNGFTCSGDWGGTLNCRLLGGVILCDYKSRR